MAMNTALAIAEKSPVAVMSTKKILGFSRENRCVLGKEGCVAHTHCSVADSLKYTAQHNSVALQSGDVKEALQAHAQKRKAVFRDSRL